MRALYVIGALCFTTALAFGQNETCDTLNACQKALQANPKSSAVHYQIGDIFFRQKNLQSAANELRAALNGDLQPKWTEVWSHVQLGKIFDLTKQRDRAINEYHLARRTNDNTRGALDEAAKYLETPYDGK
jgi:tetratricopeptide (TPR) repeat protein